MLLVNAEFIIVYYLYQSRVSFLAYPYLLWSIIITNGSWVLGL